MKLLLSLFFLISPLWAVAPSDLCSKEILDHLRRAEPSEFSKMLEVCRYAGQYKESALPDGPVKEARSSRGEVYIYDEFFESLHSLTRPQGSQAELCDDSTKKAAMTYPTVFLEKTASGDIPLSVVDEKDIEKIFADIRKESKYAFEYLEDGCWARAHLITQELEKRGIRAGKTFAEGYLVVPTDKAMNGEAVVWSYHVAPLVAVQTDKGIEMRILDASLFDKPVPVKEWTDKMMPSEDIKEDVVIYNTDRFVLDPLRGRPVSALKTDPSNGRWHIAETVLAEKDLEEKRNGLEERELYRKRALENLKIIRQELEQAQGGSL